MDDRVDELRTVRGLHLATRTWRPSLGPTIIALHGWLDNVASFDRLAALLTGYRVIAVDLPGHGLSGHRPLQGSYNIWDDLPDLGVLIDSLDLKQVILLGHSRGAVIATLLASVLGERVSHLLLLDAIYPPPAPANAVIDQLRRFVVGHAAPNRDGLRVFESIDEAIAARCTATGIDHRAAAPIVERNLESCPGGWRWRTDPRLRLASAVKLGEEQIAVTLAAITAPGLLILALDDSGRQRQETELLQHFRRLRVDSVDGEHHCHMLEQAEPIAQSLIAFLRDTPKKQ